MASSLVVRNGLSLYRLSVPAARSLKNVQPRSLGVPFSRSLKAAAAPGGQNEKDWKDAVSDERGTKVQKQPGQSQQRGGTPSLRRSSPGVLTSGDLFSMMPPGFGRLSCFARDLQDEIDSMFGGFDDGGVLAPTSSPSVRASSQFLSVPIDVHEDEKNFIFSADVPGMNKEDVKVQVTKDNMLSISGKRDSEFKEEKEGKVYRIERSVGNFQRRFQLPENVDSSGVKAKVDNGVLKVMVPKTEPTEHGVVDVNIE